MPLSNQKQVMVGLDRMNGAALRRIAKRYRKETIGPMAEAIKSTRGNKQLLRALGPGLLRKIKTDALQTAMADGIVQAGLVGVVTATPRKSLGRKR